MPNNRSGSMNKVFLAYDEDMMLHRPNHSNHQHYKERMVQPPPPIEAVGDPDFVFERPSRLRAAHDALIDLEQRLLAMNQPQRQDEQKTSTASSGDMTNDDSMPVDGGMVHGRRFVPLACHPASREAICRVHSQEHYDFMESTSMMSLHELDQLTEQSSDLYFCENTFYAARLAVGGCIHAVNAVTSPMHMSRRAICLVRPPAHHATRDAAMGT
jgi:acetoin utilization deacetylase AcuC-like enzyme